VLAAFLSRPGWRSAVPPILLLGFAAIVGRLSATGGPLCRPESLLQGHGFWHLAAAIAVTWWALLRHPETSAATPPTLVV
jgi:hypothetical protein